MLKKGSKGLAVVLLQARLRWLNYALIDQEIDGVFGEQTHIDVRDFQIYHNLVVDGIVGKNTNRLLEKLTKNAHLFTFVHCSATPEGKPFTAQQILDYHTKNLGWSRSGYSDIIEFNKFVNIHPYNSDNLIDQSEYTFGVKAATLLNRNAKHFCYVGGMDKFNENPKDTRTLYQKKWISVYLQNEILRNPKVLIIGHNQVQNKACPSFDVYKEYEYLSPHNFMKQSYQI